MNTVCLLFLSDLKLVSGPVTLESSIWFGTSCFFKKIATGKKSERQKVYLEISVTQFWLSSQVSHCAGQTG